MAAAGKHRECLIAAAVGLFRRQGYAGTGVAEILAESGAPRGSLYHYFPDGKAEIAEAAIREVGGRMSSMMQEMADASPTPGDMVWNYGTQLAGWLEKSGFRDGCAIATVVLEAAPVSAKLTAAGRDVFASWSRVVAGVLERAGLPGPRALELADFTIASLEGALILARARQSTTPILQAAGELRRLFDAELLRMKGSV